MGMKKEDTKAFHGVVISTSSLALSKSCWFQNMTEFPSNFHGSLHSTVGFEHLALSYLH